MDGMKKNFLKYFLILATGFLTGILTGVAVTCILISYRIDHYHMEIHNLQNIINERDLKLGKLEESINKNRFLLRDIKVVIESQSDELDKIELEKAIRKKYGNLIGREVKSIDAEIVAEVVDKRIMKVNNREYKISVGKILISEVMMLWIKVSQDDS